MRLTIYKNEQLDYDKSFIRYLLGRAETWMLTNINLDKLIPIDIYLNKEYFNISSYEILKETFKHLKMSNFYNKYVIEVDSDYTLPDFNEKLIKLCRIITYGNMQVKGYDILNQAFEHVASNTLKYYDEYINGGF